MNLDSTLQIRIDSETKRAFQELCSSEGTTPAALLRSFMLDSIQETEQNLNKVEINTMTLDQSKAQDLSHPISDEAIVVDEEPKREFKIGELYSGPGGLGLAASLASATTPEGIKLFCTHAWASDYDKDACQTYRQNIFSGPNCNNSSDEDPIYCCDVRHLEIERLAPIDALLFGFPCNDFSLVGETKGLEGDFGPLYSYGVKAINHHEPDWFLAENVGGLSSANEGKAFEQILDHLANAGSGYQLTAHLYKFEEYGVPQARHRIIIIGIRRDLGLQFEVPRPSFEIKTSRQALENPPIPKSASNQEPTRQSKRVVERLKHINPGQNAWNAELPEQLRLNVKSARLSHIYKRLDPDRPAYTVTGSGGGGTHMYHWSENRALTNRERARLQTFPDNYKFYGSKESVRKQIGMAVPVDGAKIIIACVLKTMAGIPYEHVSPSIGYFQPS